MWIFTKFGFFSVVREKDNSMTPFRSVCLVVRARDSVDLDRLRKEYMPALSKTVESVSRDYRYRAWIGYQDFKAGLAKIVEDIDYNNFKGEVAKTDPARAKLYENIWRIGLGIEKKKAERKKSPNPNKGIESQREAGGKGAADRA